MPTFDYFLNIPDGPNNPSNDQPRMQTNTNSIDSIIAVDHYTFEQGNLNRDGWHQQSTYPQSPVIPPNISGQLALYSFAGTFGTELHAVRDGVLANATDAVLTSAAMIAPVAATNGYTYLAGPGTGPTKGAMILQWGTNTVVTHGSFASGAADGTVSFLTSNIAFPTACFAVYTIPFYANANPPDGAGSINVAQDAVIRTAFNWKFNSNSSKYTGFYWFAVGN